MPNLIQAPSFIAHYEWWPTEAKQWAQLKADPRSHKALVQNIEQAVIEAFTQGQAVTECVHGYAVTIDHVLWHAWHTHGLHTQNIALIAVGGYGRSELHLQSDIDLMILLDDKTDSSSEQKLSEFLTFLWDSGLDVGHSVRTIAEAVEESKKDITVITSLLEARAICGNISLYNELKAATANERLWNSKDFYLAKQQEKLARHAKYGDTLYQLEPNIKEGPGGLRDIQFIDWITKRHFNNRTLNDLISHGFLQEQEYDLLSHALEFFWKIRFTLFLITRRRDERLLFDHQVELARRSGFSDSNANLAVEQFMQNYYRHLSECSLLVELLSAHFEENYLDQPSATDHSDVGAHYYRSGEILSIKSASTLQTHPEILLEIFLVLQRDPTLTKISSQSIRLIRANLDLIDHEFRNTPAHKALFIEILRQPRRVADALNRMHSLGVLAAYWPAFARIVGHMQYDLYHVYTVDHHILTVLKQARRLGDKKRTEDDISAIFYSLPKLEILYLAALFHDVAKGRDGDHSTEGSQEAMDFCLAHGLSQFDAGLVSWLVENHLIMSVTAQHKDLNDPSVVQDFADQVANVIRLNYLYLLTIADIKGTNPALWNSWRSTLLADLYKYTAFQLRAGFPRDNVTIIADLKSSALSQLLQRGCSEQQCVQFWQGHHDDYFLRHTDDEIAWHTHIGLSNKADLQVDVHIRELVRRGCTEIFIYAPDRDHLFASITDQLHQFNLSILDARIITSKTGITYNTFNVVNQQGVGINDAQQYELIQTGIKQILQDNVLSDNPIAQFIPTRMLHFQAAPQVTIKNAEHLDYTSLHIHSPDHPGLLADIAQALVQADVRVIGARVSTLGEKVHDIFHITDMAGLKITQSQQKDALINYLQEELTPADNNQSSYSI